MTSVQTPAITGFVAFNNFKNFKYLCLKWKRVRILAGVTLMDVNVRLNAGIKLLQAALDWPDTLMSVQPAAV